MRTTSLFGPATGWPSLLALLPTINALSFEAVSVPELDLSSLGRVSITGDFDGVSLYQYKEQSKPVAQDGTQALLTPLPNGILANLSSSDAQIRAMCPFTQKDGTFSGIFVGGNFTTLGGVDSPGAALFNPNTTKVTALPGLSGSVAALACDQETNRVYVGGDFSYDNTTNAVAWTPDDGWTDLSFNGLNGPVNSILKADNGHIIFGGSFDALGNSTSSKNKRQVLNLQNATVTSDSDSSLDGYSDPRNIICSTSGEAAKGSTYLLHDYAPGFWRADLGFDFFPTKIRLYNTHMEGRGTKDFLLRALPDNGIMNLTYTDESGNKASCDASCPLSSSTSEKYREFTMVNPVGMRGLQIEVLDWYGKGAGLNGIEVFQDQILTYAIDQYNEPTCAGIEYPAKSSRTGDWTVEDGYVSAKVTDSDASGTSVTFQPDIKKSGNYTIKLYTPGCTQDNTCSSRGIVNVTASLSSGSDSDQPEPSYFHQTNNDDKYDTFYTGYVDASDDSFRPEVTLRAKDGQGDITIVASRVRFELLSTTGGLNGLYDYDPTSKSDTEDVTKSDINTAGTSLNHNASISSIQEHDGVLYVAGNFSDNKLHNIMTITDGNATALSGAGFNSPVLAMAELDNVLYAGGRFTDTSDGGADGLKRVAAYSFSSKKWSALGAGLNGPVSSIWPVKLNASAAINETLVAVSGEFDQILGTDDNPAVSVAGLAIWVPSRKDWIQNLNVTQMEFGGQLSAFASHNGTLILAGNIATNGVTAGGAVSLLNSGDSLLPLSMKINHKNSSSGLITGAYDTDSDRNLTIYGGHFTAAGSNGSSVENIAIFNGSDNTISGLPQGFDKNSTFVSMLVFNNTLYAGGRVTGNISDTSLGGLIAYDVADNVWEENQPSFGGENVTVNSISRQPGSSNIFFGGNFDTVGQFPCPSVCYVDSRHNSWKRPGLALSGNVLELQWASENKLMAIGDLTAMNNKTAIATYSTKSEEWSAFPGASQSEMPGNVTVFTPASQDLSKFWIGGTASNGSAFFLSYDGSKFQSPGNLFGEGTVIRGMDVLPISKDHSAASLLDDDQTLMITGSLVIPNFGNASAAFYNGTVLTPFILSSQSDGQSGSMSKFFSQHQNPFKTTSKHHSNGIAVLVAFCCALGCVFLIVLAGVILNKIQRRRQGYAAAPQTFGTDRPSDMQRLPPEYLFNSLGQPNPVYSTITNVLNRPTNTNKKTRHWTRHLTRPLWGPRVTWSPRKISRFSTPSTSLRMLSVALPVRYAITNCLTCRTRKLKCDEEKPECSQCRKGGRECRPSEGVVFRHQQNASMNRNLNESPQGRGNLNGFYSYKNTFDKDSVWLDVPKHVIFVDNSDPYAEDLEASLAEPGKAAMAHSPDQRWGSNGSRTSDAETQRLEALSAVATHDRFPYSPMDHSLSDSTSYPSPNQRRSAIPPASPSISLSSTSNNTNINFLLNPSHSMSPPIDPSIQLSDRSTALPSRPAVSKRSMSQMSISHMPDDNAETDFETAFFLRHYSEGPGLWMDLFDLGTYFASYVPVRARSNPLLKYAACAYAAKQLGRVKGAKAPMGGVCTQQAAMELWPDKDPDFAWYGAKYYEKAIQILMRELQPNAEGPPPLSTPEAFGQWQASELSADTNNPRKRRRRVSDSRLSHGVHSDEVLAATAILSVYEFLDAAGPAWNRHLSGVKSLLDVAEVGMMPLEQRSPGENSYQTSTKKSSLSKARRATFWNFARQDYLAAFINESHTRLNTDDTVLWTEAGLLLDNAGFIRPSNTGAAGYPEGEETMKEDLVSNGLVWIMSKIVNFISSGDNVHLTDNRPMTGPLGVTQQALLERWYRLESELDAWYSGVPETFRPCARMDPSKLTHHRPAHENEDISTLQEIWFSLPMCASTMQHYHMARILLLINKPHESTSRRSTITLRLQSYRSIEADIAFHSREIVGIGLSRPDGSVRINSLQPLFVAGQCLTDARERRTTVRLLRSIECDLGWATEYRVQQLMKEWGWDESTSRSPKAGA
ncbi:unnamed protein product [Penicillium olsonii]|nr:unnamed protein product [Penicillium olsonii]